MIQKIYSLCHENAFYWVRFSTLENQVCKKHNITLTKLHQSINIKGGSYLLVNRFSYSLFYKILFRLVDGLKIPYIFDIDDLYWELPPESIDLAGSSLAYKQFIDKRIRNATVVTTTNNFLAEKLGGRFNSEGTKGEKSKVDIRVVPNAVPNWYAPKGGVVIANSDAFKLSSAESSWFKELLIALFNNNIPVQFIGGNKGAVDIDEELKFYFINNLSYQDYLKLLNTGDFKYGLIPVTNSNYASAKSDIKIQEFKQAGIKIYASCILPYEHYQGSTNVELVENTPEAWKAAVNQIIHELKHKTSISEDYLMRTNQLQVWEGLVKDFSCRSSKFSYMFVSLFMLVYLGYFVRSRDFVRSLIQPVLNFLKCFSK